MNTTNPNLSLTDYQKAVLTHMGITPWVERSALSLETDSTATHIDVETQTCQNKPSPISNAANQEEKLAGLQRLKQQIVDTPSPTNTPKATQVASAQQVTRKDAEMAMVLCMDNTTSQSAMVQDVLKAIAHASDKVIVSDQPIESFQNFSFAWQFGDEMSFSNKVLTTPAIDQLVQVKQKKALWQHLIHGN